MGTPPSVGVPTSGRSVEVSAQPIVIIGAGGQGRETLSVLDDISAMNPGKYRFLGFIDDGGPDVSILARLDEVQLGGTEVFESLPAGTAYSIGVNDGSTRRRISERADAAGLEAVTLRHPMT